MEYLATLISLLLGMGIVLNLYSTKNTSHPLLVLCVSLGLGLGVSGLLTWTSFLFFNQLIKAYVIALHMIAIPTLFFIGKHKIKNYLQHKPSLQLHDYIALGVALFFIVILGLKNIFYPHGGWDAWAFWSTKAQFLFYGGTHWQNVFDPLLDRLNASYPLLMPLMYVWLWCFQENSSTTGPMIITIIFPLIVSGILAYGLKALTEQKAALFSGLLLLSIPLYQLLGASQYADILVAFYLLTGLMMMLLAIKNNDACFYSLSVLSIGLLSYSKSEGLAIAILLTTILMAITINNKKISLNKKHIIGLLILFGITFLPIIIHKIHYIPGNARFINGLVSTESPTSWSRFSVMLYMLGQELISLKWHGIWPLSLIGVMTAWRKSFVPAVRILPIFLICYSIMVIFYYTINTYYPIIWWMQTSIKRIVLTCIPIMILWSFYSILLLRKETRTNPPSATKKD